MSIDARVRAAAAEARRVAASEVDAAAMLARLHRTHRHRAVGRIVTAVVLVGALITGVMLVAGRSSGHRVNLPARPTVTPSSSCGAPAVACLGNDRFRVALPVPVVVRLPANFFPDFSVYSNGFDALRRGQQAGVTVMEAVIPAKNDASWTRDRTAGTTAESMAVWLSHRPFLEHAVVGTVSVGGRRAWRVSAELKPGAPLRAVRQHVPIAPTFINADRSRAGFGRDRVGDYVLLDTASAGVAVIWSWSAGAGRQVLPANAAFISGLTFG